MSILLVLGLCLLVWFLCVGWLHWYFIARYPVKGLLIVGSYWRVDCQPFYGTTVQVQELSNKDYPNGVLVMGISQDSHSPIYVWINKEKLLPLHELQGHG